jgi:hypothetical protein
MAATPCPWLLFEAMLFAPVLCSQDVPDAEEN